MDFDARRSRRRMEHADERRVRGQHRGERLSADALSRRANTHLRVRPRRRIRPARSVHSDPHERWRLSNGNERGAPGRRPSQLLEVVLELAAPRGVPQLAQRLRLDLTDALAGHVELATDLLERPGAAVLETEPQLQHAPLAAGESFEDGLDLLLEELVTRRVGGREGLVVRDEVPEVRILFLADRRLERDGLLRDLHDLADLVRGDEHPLRDLLRGRLTAELLEESTRHANELVDRLDHVDRDADRPRLVRDRTRDRLADPPRRVRRELVTLAVVELPDRADEAGVPLLG